MQSRRHGWLVVALAAGLICPLAARAAGKTKIIQAELRTEPLKGWGPDKQLPDDLKAAQLPEKFTRVPATASSHQTFSGVVLDVKPEQKVEIGVVALIGTHWLSNGNYDWFPVDASRAFSVVSTNHPEAAKSLVMRADGSPWTFLRARFKPGEGAKDIQFHMKPTMKVNVSMEDAQANPVAIFRAEIFNAFIITDDDGKELPMERYGHMQSKRGVMALDFPPEPMSILLEAGPKIAPYYATIDPREANNFHFKMLEASRIMGVVTRDGKPAEGVLVHVSNGAAPLSAVEQWTDAAGRFDLPGRTPGTDHLKVGSYQTEVELKPGETANLKIDLSVGAPPPR